MIEFPNDLLKGTLSSPKNKTNVYQKAKFQEILIKEDLYYQFSFYTQQQVFHKNILQKELNSFLNQQLEQSFNCLEVVSKNYSYSYRVTKSGKVLSNKKKIQEQFVSLEHNKSKKYLLDDGNIIPPLVDLGVMTQDGKIVKGKYEKYRQINRFLEMIEDSIADEKYLKIIDFGCGKSYLTFLLYYYLIYVKKIECDILGMDLKEEVIDHCNEIAKKYGYHRLTFIKKDISEFKEEDHIDMIVTLHACDTATDYALAYAIKMKCRYIFSVPCCQHELNLQMKQDKMHILTKYGILKERMAALMTDAIRANILQYYGYKTQVLEFIDLEASPKNILIRAVYEQLPPSKIIKEEIEELLKYFNMNQTLYNLTMGTLK